MPRYRLARDETKTDVDGDGDGDVCSKIHTNTHVQH